MSLLRISSDAAELDVDLIHRYLAEESYWARGIPRATLERALQHSLCFGAYLDAEAGTAQIGFARVITDYASFANLVDVFVLGAHRGKGYGKALMQAVFAHPQLQGLRRFTLATSDAHGLYARFGFTAPHRPETLMERFVADIYRAPKAIPPPQKRRS